MTTDATALMPFPIRLADVFCVHCLAHRDQEMPEGASPGIQLNVARSELGNDGKAFSCRLTVTANYAVLEHEALSLEVTVQGNFESNEPISPDLFEAFTQYTPVSLLWPYARAYSATLGQMVGVALPPLPTLDALNPLGSKSPEPAAQTDE